MDCGQIATECMEADHTGHEYYLLGDGEETIKFINEFLSEPLKQILNEKKELIKSRPPSPPIDYTKLNLDFTSVILDEVPKKKTSD
jgi:hypothetical protein